jgi:cytochrome c-type biogenesis protein CcmH/NrfF
MEEETMPVILLWGIPTLIVVVGGGYWLIHMHH